MDLSDLARRRASVVTRRKNAQLSEQESDRVRETFKGFECSEGFMQSKDLPQAMKQLGLNPTEAEILEMINEMESDDNLITLSKFRAIVSRRLREDEEENFHMTMWRALVGPTLVVNQRNQMVAAMFDPDQRDFSRQQFEHVMSNLPEEVSASEIDAMFSTIDKDGSGRISYDEFKQMCGVAAAEEPDRVARPELGLNTRAVGIATVAVLKNVINAAGANAANKKNANPV